MAENKITADKKAEEAVKEVKAEVSLEPLKRKQRSSKGNSKESCQDGRKGSKDRSKGNKGKEGNCKESS